MISKEQKVILEKTGNLLRALRTQKNLSQKQLAFEIGVSRSKYQDMEKGNANFALLDLYKLAEVLEIDPHKLIVPLEKRV